MRIDLDRLRERVDARRASRAVALLTSMVVAVALLVPVTAQAALTLEPDSFKVTSSSVQAGAHADLITEFAFVHNRLGETAGNLRDVVVNLPVGFDASDVAAPTCTGGQLSKQEDGLTECPIASQVGTMSVAIKLEEASSSFTVPLYNMQVTDPGIAAEFGFNVFGIIQQEIVFTVRPDDLGITATTPNIEGLGEISKVVATVWGVPGAASHDEWRGRACGEGKHELNCKGGDQSYPLTPKPLLANPTSCTGVPLTASFSADSWQEPTHELEAQSQFEPIIECDRLPFSPSMEAQPSTRAAESPTGLEVALKVPQLWDNTLTPAVANVKDTEVTLPEGMTANPGLAEGLGACSPQQYAEETAASPPGVGCPPESKIGSIDIETPLLAEKIPGAVYMATPYDNPFSEPGHPHGSLLALYVVGKEPERGILIKVAGKITPNPVTGQLVTTFDDTPQQPFSKFTLKFRPGAAAPLISPPACGSYVLNGTLTPWSTVELPGEALVQPSVLASQPFAISEGVGGGACPTGGVPPFHPTAVAGTQNNAGGSYSPFYMRLMRNDGEQELVKFSTTMPPGLTGNLTGIPFCPDGDIEAAKGKSGAQEQANPSCPAASEIGHTLVGAGVGSVLAQNPGKLYLAGPYHGAPMSIVSITSAKVGPFDLGTVVIRFALDINPITAQVEISGAASDPIPRIIDGIVVHVRDIRVYVDRSNFIMNPTDCIPLSIENQITGANPLNATQQTTVGVQSHFEAADCASLAFTPTFKVTTSAHTSRTQGASLDTKVTVPAGSLGKAANIKSVKVDLPYQLPSRLTTLQKACTSKQFEANPAGCPGPSRVGTATVHTPIVPVPLTGPAYFVSYGAAKFPELIVVLQGYGITIDLHGETFISKKGITSTTFRSVPDEPFESFELDLPQGPYSALTNNGSLCNAKQTVTTTKRVKRKVKGHVRYVKVKVHKTVKGLLMPTALTGQNGAVIHETNRIAVTGCPKTKAHKTKAHKTGKHKGRGK